MTLKQSFVCGCLCAAFFTPAAIAQVGTKPSTPAPAGPPTVTGPSKVAIINIQEAIMTSEEGKKLNDALQARFAPKRAELDSAQKELTTLQNQLSAGGNTMSQSAKDDLTRQIASKTRDLQQSSDNAQSDYQNAQTELMNTVGNKIMPIIKTYAEEHGYTAVIDVSLGWPQNPVLYYNPGTVITSDIIKLYNTAHPVAAPAKPGA